jgi:hypothetical protein
VEKQRRSTLKITIDIEKTAAAVAESGVRPEDIRAGDFAGLSDAIIDALEEIHGVETAVVKTLIIRAES